MFTAQVFEREKTKVGMNKPLARDTLRLLLNVMHCCLAGQNFSPKASMLDALQGSSPLDQPERR